MVKKFLSYFLILLMAFSIVLAPLTSVYADTTNSTTTSTNQSGATNKPDHITLSWTKDPKTTQTITWRTDVSTTNSVIQYALEADETNFPQNAKVVNGSVSKLSSDLGDMNIHTGTIRGLEPGTTYVYRVGDGTNWSDIHTFTTEAENTKSFKFLIFGDSQSGIADTPEYGPWQKTIHNSIMQNPDAKFIVNVGDFVEIGWMYQHWNNWFDAAKGVIDNIPEMPVQGNHETYKPGYKSDKPKVFVSQFQVPQNGPDGLKGQTYSYDYGNAHIVVLDSQEAEEAPVAGDILKAQQKWLENDLKNTNKTWKLVFFHKTPYYLKATRSNEDIKAAFGPIFDKYHVDMVFNGHDHGYSRTYPIYNNEFVNSPAKGTVYVVTGRSGNKKYPDLTDKIWNQAFYDPQDQPMYIAADVNGDKLTIQAIKQDGTVIDTYTINKAEGSDYPQTVLPKKYDQTQVILYGKELVNGNDKVTAQNINNVYYIPAEIFIKSIGGTYNKDQSNINITYNKITAALTIGSNVAKVNDKLINLPDVIIQDKNNNIMISADDILTLFNISYKYDSTFNMILFPSGIKPVTSRFDGKNRYEVAVSVSSTGYPNGTSNVILVNGSNDKLGDALTAIPLAKALNAPILLTDLNTIPDTTSKEITRLNPQNIYIIGGTGSVSQAIVDQLKEKYNVKRIGGANRYEVSMNVTDALKKALNVTSFNKVYVCNGYKFADALAIAPIAAKEKYPIVFVSANVDSDTANAQNYIKKLGATNVDAIGGYASISDNVIKQLNAARIDGKNRAAISVSVASKYYQNSDGVFIVNGYCPADALALGVYAAQYNKPILYIEGDGKSINSAVTDYINANNLSIKSMIVAGGTASVTTDALRTINNQF